MAAAEVEAFLTHLAVQDKVSASTQNQALNALVFLYRHVLRQDFGLLEGVQRAKRSQRVPVVLSKAEVARLLAALPVSHDFRGPGGRATQAVSPPRDEYSTGDSGRSATGWADQTSNLPHLAAFLRHASVGEWLRHPHRAKFAGPQGRDDDADLHACDAEAGNRREKPAGQLL